MTVKLCEVCLYRRDGFIDGHLYPVKTAVMCAYSGLFVGVIVVCREHWAYLDPEYGWSMCSELPQTVFNGQELVKIWP